MKSKVINSAMTAAALTLAVSFSSQVNAEVSHKEAMPGAAIQTIRIPYSTAELNTDTGRANLYARIKRAAEEVCGPTGLREAGSLALSSRNRKCHEEAVGAAVAQVGIGQLAER